MNNSMNFPNFPLKENVIQGNVNYHNSSFYSAAGILECRNITKSYKRFFPVINNLTLSIPQGKIIGLLGPNGCGKTTLIKMIAGLLQADSGEITVCGHPIGEESKALVSYLPDRPYFNNNMKVSEIFDYFSDFYADFDRIKAENLLKDLYVDPSAKFKTLSKGTKEKVQLVLVMSRNAKLYLLDEPIAGVDPVAREYILNTIVSNYNVDATVIITTHLITDIEPILDDYIFMTYGGVVISSGSAEAVRNETGKSLDKLFKDFYRR